VIDASSPALLDQQAEVERVLREIGADDVPQVLVFNKLDRLDESQRPRTLVDRVEVAPGRQFSRVFVSAVDGTGLDELRQVIADAAMARLNLLAGASLDGAASVPPIQPVTIA